MNITIIYLEDEMILSKKQYHSWRELQDEYEGYRASLGPWSTEDVIEYLKDEYINLHPDAEAQVEDFASGSSTVATLTFRE